MTAGPRRFRVCRAPGLIVALNPCSGESHGSTESVPKGLQQRMIRMAVYLHPATLSACARSVVATGLSKQEIADRTVVSPFTIRAHVQGAMTKLHARGRAQLVAIAFHSGLVRVQENDTDSPS